MEGLIPEAFAARHRAFVLRDDNHQIIQNKSRMTTKHLSHPLSIRFIRKCLLGRRQSMNVASVRGFTAKEGACVDEMVVVVNVANLSRSLWVSG